MLIKNILLGHRGVLKNKENSLKGITGIKFFVLDGIHFGVEFDVQLLRDGSVVCYHDMDMRRLHRDHRKLIDVTYFDVEKYKIPTLDIVLKNFIPSSPVILNIEIKTYNYNVDQINLICWKVVDLIEQHKLEKNCVITSFDVRVINKLLEKNLIDEIGLIVHNTYDITEIEILRKNGMKYLVVNKEIVFDMIQVATTYNLYLLVYTFFSNKETYESDSDLVHVLKNMTNIGFITDNMNKCLNILR